MEFLILSTAEMEFVALSDRVLTLLAREDPDLNKVFRGVFPADKLSSIPKWTVFSDAYITIQYNSLLTLPWWGVSVTIRLKKN